MGSSGYNQSQQNMMNIMGGARPSEVASKGTWQGVQGFPYQASQQPDITNAGSIFGVNGMFGGAPTASQSFVSPGNVVSLTGGKGGVNFGSMFGGNNGGGSYAGENVGQGPPAGVGIDQYGYGPGNAGVGMVGPSQASPNQAANIVGAFTGLAKGGIFGPAMNIGKGAFNSQPSAFDSMVFDALSFVSGYPSLAVQQSNFDMTMDQIGPMSGSSTGHQGTASEDSMGGYSPGPGFGPQGNAIGGLDPSGIPGMGGGAGGASPAK